MNIYTVWSRPSSVPHRAVALAAVVGHVLPVSHLGPTLTRVRVDVKRPPEVSVVELVVRDCLEPGLSEVRAHLPALHVRHQVGLGVAVATNLLQILPVPLGEHQWLERELS